MEISQNFEAVSICTELNLNTEDLNVEHLLSNPTYRRFYNIVVHDTNKTEYEYRKNLIKQLYFLLKITPIMKPQLQETYLEKLQKWYNVNDHKKTELGSGRLRNLVQQYATTKQGSNDKLQARPQSGVDWNKDVNPFLRPYTAKRPTNYQNRPESYKSKFGQSTKASTKLQSCEQITIREFALSIREEFQVSQQFLRKNRTIHPQSEPIYEQLFSIIKKAGIGMKFNKNEDDNQNQYLFQRDKQQFLNSNHEDNRITQKQQQNDEDQMLNQVNDFGDQFDKVSEESQKEQEDKQKEESVHFEKKIYTRDQNVYRNHQNTQDHDIQGFYYLKNQNQNDTLLLKKANNKYSHVTNNKFVNYSKDDNEIIRSYVNYTRVKSAMKKQFNRKRQTKRLLSAKTRSNTSIPINNQNISLTNNTKQKHPRIYSALPKRSVNSFARNSDKPQIINPNGAQVFDFSEAASNKQNSLFLLSSPKYNQRTQLDQLYRKPIENYKKFNKNNISVSQIKCKGNNLLTRYDCFLTRQKIDPIAKVHVQNHNEEALEQIQKIKQKIGGLGKKMFSTDSLMKALYIDSYDTIQSCQSINKRTHSPAVARLQQKNADQQLEWKNRNPYFNMISNGQKKMKKKTRKLHKK